MYRNKIAISLRILLRNKFAKYSIRKAFWFLRYCLYKLTVPTQHTWYSCICTVFFFSFSRIVRIILICTSRFPFNFHSIFLLFFFSRKCLCFGMCVCVVTSVCVRVDRPLSLCVWQKKNKYLFQLSVSTLNINITLSLSLVFCSFLVFFLSTVTDQSQASIYSDDSSIWATE